MSMHATKKKWTTKSQIEEWKNRMIFNNAPISLESIFNYNLNSLSENESRIIVKRCIKKCIQSKKKKYNETLKLKNETLATQ